jgi:NADPH:quinone reductase-like Zn-dependent oxidoreductase
VLFDMSELLIGAGLMPGFMSITQRCPPHYTAPARNILSGAGVRRCNVKALIRDRYGSPDVLEIRDIATPTPGAGEVLVRVHAASINDWDWGLLHGPSLPFSRAAPVPILGSDIAGRVAAVGERVERLAVGDEVYGDLSRFGSGGWGGFAELVCAPETALRPKPAAMTFEQAAALPQAGQLAVQGLAAGGALRPGQRMLINGAGGGVGTIGVQLARTHGVHITGVDRAAKFDVMRRLGFDEVIDYTKEDFTGNGERYDLIVDTRTTRSPARYAAALAAGGTYATVGGDLPRLLQVALAGIGMRLITSQRLRLITLRPNQDLSLLSERFEAGQLSPVIDGPYPLSEARDAFRRFGSGLHQGKIVITIAE